MIDCVVCVVIFQTLDNQTDQELRTHLQIFHDHTDEDYEEFSHRYDSARIEFEYPLQYICMNFHFQHLLFTAYSIHSRI